MSGMDKCACGKTKPESRDICFDCMVAEEEEKGQRCECGNRKSQKDDVCAECEYE